MTVAELLKEWAHVKKIIIDCFGDGIEPSEVEKMLEKILYREINRVLMLNYIDLLAARIDFTKLPEDLISKIILGDEK